MRSRAGLVVAGAALALVTAGCELGDDGSDDARDPPAGAEPFAAFPPGWTSLPTPPFARAGAAAVWTGASLFYWGGERYSSLPRADGAVYDAAARRWSRVPQGPLAPRSWPAAAWTGEEVLVWGGTTGREPLADGAAYDPERQSWRALPAAPLSARTPAAAAWTGREFLVWGNADRASLARTRDGAAYDPGGDRWRRLPPAPLALNETGAAWTGRELVVVGAELDGSNVSRTRFAQAMAYDPEADRWRLLPLLTLSPQAADVVWTGRLLVAWDYLLQARTYEPSSDRWEVVPRVPLDPAECYPRTLALGEAVLAWYCGEAAVRLGDGVWSRVRPPRRHLPAEPVAAGEVALVLGTRRPAMWAFRPPARPEPVRLVEIPRRRLDACRRSRLLRPVCPRRVPEVVGGWWLSHVFRESGGGMHVFNLEHGGEWPGRPEWNRPPGMAHIVLVGGAIRRISPSGDPQCGRRERLADGVMRRERTGVVCFGALTAGRRRGDLFLAPGFPLGGMIGNHLVFRWREHGRRYALSLHAWEPLTEAAAVLGRLAAAGMSATETTE